MANLTNDLSAMTKKVRLIRASDVPPEASRLATIDGAELLVCHSKGTFAVVANRCSHADEKLDCGRVRNGWIACPVHGARFNLATGLPMNPPATKPITSYPTEVVDGWVEVEIEIVRRIIHQ